MEKIYQIKNGPSVYVGDDLDYEKIEKNPDFRSARCCKYGPGGHQQTCGYTTPGAPKNKDYLFKIAPNRIAVNILDLEDPNMVPFECIKAALDYAKEQIFEKGKNFLFACNSGHSRGPSTGLAFLRSIGEMPHNFHVSEKIYHTIYHKYDPGMGVRQVLRSHWSTLENSELPNG